MYLHGRSMGTLECETKGGRKQHCCLTLFPPSSSPFCTRLVSCLLDLKDAVELGHIPSIGMDPLDSIGIDPPRFLKGRVVVRVGDCAAGEDSLCARRLLCTAEGRPWEMLVLTKRVCISPQDHQLPRSHRDLTRHQLDMIECEDDNHTCWIP